jgi:NAD(P)-dependent dehydrogenase (short-subunit alcohol dehydrogenase family)
MAALERVRRPVKGRAITVTRTNKQCVGKVALVVGASQGGTGTGAAIRLAAEGARVAICARSTGKLRATLERIDDVGGPGAGAMFTCDVADPKGGRDTLVARTEEAFGPIDYLVYVAAAGGYAPFETIGVDELQHALEVNVKAPWILFQHTVASLRARAARGGIVAIGTKAARPIAGPPFADTPPVRAGTAYGGTKAALHRIVQGVAAETFHDGIVVNVLAPLAAIGTPALRAAGWIPDDMFEPVETMVESTLALLRTATPSRTGQDLYSIELLRELQQPVYDLTGTELIEGWQPEDLPAYMAARAEPVPLSGPYRSGA